ncbi:aminoglycoside phosphotransferase family protein [Pseudactinotalea sp.]|uniref:aminoglycoside phosphotransferase family protein n=1 Tax=Pseudactinotalea sp. TaxID=1926260 RepID=UPI003B3BAD06
MSVRGSGEFDSIPPAVPRLDAPRVLAALARAGVRLELIGAAPGGEVGAAFVRWPDGHEGVLTRAGDGSAASEAALRQTADVLDLARARGVPVPRYDLIARVGETHAVVQDRLPGSAPERVEPELVHEMLAAAAAWDGLLAERSDLTPAPLHLTASGPGFCLHESLAGYDDRTRALLRRVREIGQHIDHLDGDDLVHLDFHPGNVLVDADGRLTGIVDWDGWGRGDRWFSIEVLAFDLARRRTDAAVRAHVDERLLEAVRADRLLAYRAHLALRQVDWSIRHHSPADVDDWLTIAVHRLDAVG